MTRTALFFVLNWLLSDVVTACLPTHLVRVSEATIMNYALRVRQRFTKPACCCPPALPSPFIGAGSPRPELPPTAVLTLLMRALELNDIPEADAGLKSMWEFAGDTTRFIFKNNISEFIESAHLTAAEHPTSFYGMAMRGQGWEVEGPINMVGGDTDACWIATQVIKTISCDGRMRRWQWELRKNRRPPMLGSWYVESIGSSDRHGNFDIEG
mmetsp:Transcript_33270/g.54962  ORF Transcript_33270/g.54962 Transcript_33270/m.54962 type:complete len:212 (-) Transcript_33270:422-1057(-)